MAGKTQQLSTPLQNLRDRVELIKSPRAAIATMVDGIAEQFYAARTDPKLTEALYRQTRERSDDWAAACLANTPAADTGKAATGGTAA